MIQRIQSLFLLGVIIISVILFFVPLSEKSAVENDQTIMTSLVINPVSKSDISANDVNYVLLSLNVIVLLLSAYIIFQYKKRQSQMLLCSLTGILTGIELALVFYFSEKMVGEGMPHYLAGTYLIAIQVFFLLAARRFIHKDDKLVRASQRIR